MKVTIILINRIEGYVLFDKDGRLYTIPLWIVRDMHKWAVLGEDSDYIAQAIACHESGYEMGIQELAA